LLAPRDLPTQRTRSPGGTERVSTGPVHRPFTCCTDKATSLRDPQCWRCSTR
jgi:hypothetical protein